MLAHVNKKISINSVSLNNMDCLERDFTAKYRSLKCHKKKCNHQVRYCDLAKCYNCKRIGH